MLELLILVCSSALPCGTLSICLSDTHIMGSGHVLLYPLDTVPTRSNYVVNNGNVTACRYELVQCE